MNYGIAGKKRVSELDISENTHNTGCKTEKKINNYRNLKEMEDRVRMSIISGTAERENRNRN